MFKKILSCCALILSSATFADSSAFYFAPSIVLNNTTSGGSSERETLARLAIGYGSDNEKSFYLGGEVFFVPGSIVVNNRHSYGPTVRNTHGLGLSILPGIKLNESSMIFFRLGGVETHFSYHNNYDSGVQVGVGLSTHVSLSCDVRGEYVYTAYHSMGGILAPRSDWYGIGLVYKFE